MRKTWGQLVATSWVVCGQFGHLFTQNVFEILTHVGNSCGFTQYYQRFFPLLFHAFLGFFTAVSGRVLPIIPSAYNKNNKVYLINSYIY